MLATKRVPADSQVMLSVIVPAHNEEACLPACLGAIREALDELEAQGVETEIVVCDDSSTDRTADVARRARRPE